MQERRHERFFLDAPPSVVAYLQCDPSRAENKAPVEILDLSVGGVKLRLDESLPVLSRVRIRIVSTALNEELTVSALVCWARPVEEKWWIGCSFDSPIADSTLQELASAGCIDRRREIRVSVEADILVAAEGSHASSRAQMIDISKGGFAMTSQASRQIGERVVIRSANRLVKHERIVARVRWSRCVEDGNYRTGCSFINPEAGDACHNMLTAIKEQAGPQKYLAAMMAGVASTSSRLLSQQT